MAGSALRVPSGARQRALQFAGTAVGLAASSTAAAAGTASLAKTLLLTVSLGAVGGGLASFAASEAFTRAEARSAAPTAAAPPRARRVGSDHAPSVVPTPAGAELRFESEERVAPSDESRTPPPPSASSSKKKSTDMAPPTAPAGAPGLARRPSLFEEQSIIETARAAVTQGDAARALATLDSYERSYPQKQFGPEALALRIGALRAGGQASRAEALAREFEQRYPHHPLLSRVQNR